MEKYFLYFEKFLKIDIIKKINFYMKKDVCSLA